MPVASGRSSQLGHIRESPWERTPRVRQLFAAWALALMFPFCSCEPKLVVGEWTCSQDGKTVSIPARTDPISVPWSTGFENGFCDFELVGGFCISSGTGSHETVSSPVHGGEFAAAFTVNSADASGFQSRCVREGVFPETAYYGAWYYVPALATNTEVWNLFHFRGGDAEEHGLWDVSLVNDGEGNLRVAVWDHLNGVDRAPADPVPIPLGEWFHLVFYLRRAADETGKMALYQNDRLLVEATDLVTDDTDWGQWYVGNLANELDPPVSTLYVDDVTIGSTR